MLLNIASLDDLHIYGNMLADKKSDKQLLEEVDEFTGSLAEKYADQDLEKHHVLKTPYLHAGNTFSAGTSLGTTCNIALLIHATPIQKCSVKRVMLRSGIKALAHYTRN